MLFFSILVIDGTTYVAGNFALDGTEWADLGVLQPELIGWENSFLLRTGLNESQNSLQPEWVTGGQCQVLRLYHGEPSHLKLCFRSWSFQSTYSRGRVEGGTYTDDK
jgi:hypothetical protein